VPSSPPKQALKSCAPQASIRFRRRGRAAACPGPRSRGISRGTSANPPRLRPPAAARGRRSRIPGRRHRATWQGSPNPSAAPRGEWNKRQSSRSLPYGRFRISHVGRRTSRDRPQRFDERTAISWSTRGGSSNPAPIRSCWAAAAPSPSWSRPSWRRGDGRLTPQPEQSIEGLPHQGAPLGPPSSSSAPGAEGKSRAGARRSQGTPSLPGLPPPT
jgi:hypothetical protein